LSAFDITPITWTPDPIPTATQGAAFSHTLDQGSGGSATLVYSLASGSLPNGLTFTPATRVISGIPTEAGSFPLTFSVTDGITAEQFVTTINVSADPFAPRNITISVGERAYLAIPAQNFSSSTMRYKWYKAPDAVTTGGTVIKGANRSVYVTPAMPAAGTHYYYVEITSAIVSSSYSQKVLFVVTVT